MSREEAIEHLGTIAKSGTAEFLARMTGDQKQDAQLIGQFGVGFYSSFIVADRVDVYSRRAGLDAAAGVHWQSSGDGEFSVATVELPERGTRIVLHLKEGEQDFADGYRIRALVRKYSDHIAFPVRMHAAEESKRRATSDAAPEYETVNHAQALWTRPRTEVKDEEYKEFYRHITHDFTDPLAWSHGKVEGTKEYTSLLYVPARAPFDLWHREAARGLKLYVRRVFIMDDAEQFLPLYLRFVKGVVDSADLPLNISREMLQQDAAIDGMRTGLARRVLDLLAKLAKDEPEKYASFWKEFGTVLKEGPAEDHANRERIAKLLRFSSTHADKEEQDVSLEDYVARMKPEQKEIYFVIADNFAAAKSSPHLEVLRSKGIEVLLLSDRVDEWLVDHLREFDGKQLRNVARGELDIGAIQSDEEKQQQETLSKEHCGAGRAHQEVAAGSRERRARHEPPRRFAGGAGARRARSRRADAAHSRSRRAEDADDQAGAGNQRQASAAAADRVDRQKTPPSTTCRCCYSSRRRLQTAVSWRSRQRSCSGSTGCCSRCIEVISPSSTAIFEERR